MSADEVKKAADGGGEFDENAASTEMDRYSRAIAALGVETMRSLGALRVLVVGLQGVGVETAKNLILSGPKQVTVHDDTVVTRKDMGTNFYLTEKHVAGKVSRSKACVETLGELNPYVTVDAAEGKLSDAQVAKYGAVIVTVPLPAAELTRLNKVCRAQKPQATFLLALTHGVTGLFFSDFGDEHRVTDADGEPKLSHVVEDITPEGVVTVADSKAGHGLADDDRVTFEEVEGMEALNGATVRVKRIYKELILLDKKTGKKVKRRPQVFDKFQIVVEDVPGGKLGGAWTGGGIVTEVKPTKVIPFRSLADSLVNPAVDDMDKMLGLRHPDQARWMSGRGSQLHFAYLALLRFQAAHKGALPALHDQKDADECVKHAKAALAEHKAAADGAALVVEAVDEDVVRKTALYARTELPGYCAFLGGVAAQEVVKKFGRFTPVQQWLHVDHFELLTNEGGKPPADARPIDSRYDYQISVFGQAVQNRIMNQKWFLVGCGALGCEYIKGFALMGIGTGRDGHVTLTDMDRIELSNLSRQFLFRSQHVGKPKSVCAAAVAQQMNPDLKLTTLEEKAWPGSEGLFDDEFWDGLTGVWNALDNVQARRYIDSKCLLHGRPLMESGTQGTKANSEIILPGLTKSYSDNKDQETGGIAACTLRNFPHLIVHCIEWARPQFEELFELNAEMFNTMLEDRGKFLAQVEKESSTSARANTLRTVRDLLERAKSRTFETCVDMAFTVFHKQFRTRIQDLVHFFPADAKVKDEADGSERPFWSGHKRFPNVAEFSADDPLHMSFLRNAANLFAFQLGVDGGKPVGEADFAKRIKALKLKHPAWQKPARGIDLSEGKDSKGDEEEKKDDAAESAEMAADAADEKEVADLIKFFQSVDTKGVAPLHANEFEKDDDSNGHVDFLTACSNLRAWNYRIKPTTRHNCKMVAGKIIAALATTTAMVTGLVELEYYKTLLGLKKEQFFNSNVNLALGTFNFFEVEDPVKAQADFDVVMQEEIKPVPEGFTSWDWVVVDEGRDLTVSEFFAAFPKAHHGVKPSLLFKYGITEKDIGEGKGKPLVASFQLKDQGERKVSELYVEKYGPLVSEKRRYVLLDGSFESEDGALVKIPTIKYVFRKKK